VVKALPGGCEEYLLGDTRVFYQCEGGLWFKRVFRGGTVQYVAVNPPM